MEVTEVVSTTWPEVAVLDAFWDRVRADMDRLDLLMEMASIRLERPSDWDERSIRQAMAGVRMTLTADGCFACRSRDRWLYWHHVIQVQHGGSNYPRNLVALCHRCHRVVHPWLPEPTSLENRFGWTSLKDLAGRVVDKLVARWEVWQRP